MAVGEFDDRPEGLFPYAAPPAFAVAIVGIIVAFMTFGGGGSDEPTPGESAIGLGGVVCSPLDTFCFGGRVAFGSERDGNLEIYTMNADGSGEILRLTNNPGKDGDPSWSPDGSTIVFETDRHGELFEIYSMNADGSGLRRLTISDTSESRYVNVEPVWSPDGSLIAFTSTRDGNAVIYTMKPDGSEQRQLVNMPGQGADWSPDGASIAFFSVDAENNFDVYVAAVSGGEITRLTTDAAKDEEPAWSPDGRKLAFKSARDGNPEIYVMNVDGTEQVRLTNNPADDTEPSWSPDGQQIIFRSSRDGNDDLYTMFADGTGQVRLTSALASDGQPVWTAGATPVETRSETRGDLAAVGETDYFVFTAEQGVTYTLTATPDTLRDVHLHLWRGASREVKLTDVRGLGPNFVELAWTAPNSGPVFASIESYSDKIGEYEFAVKPSP
jgi:TolB protein